jgi:hypothetical protein
MQPVVLLAASICVSATLTHADAPDNTFKKAQGDMYCSANPGQPACHGHRTLTITLDSGYTIDRSFHQSSMHCCGGRENHNGDPTAIPAGVYVELTGGSEGEWGVFNIKLVADSSNVGDDGVVKAWTIEADSYCGPTGKVGGGGCNVHGVGWIKQMRK